VTRSGTQLVQIGKVFQSSAGALVPFQIVKLDDGNLFAVDIRDFP
jgi:hypothetical protein